MGEQEFQTGDQVSVVRGKLRGRAGKVIKFDGGNESYAVELDGGTLAVVNASNWKAPADATISASQLAAAIFDAHIDRAAADHLVSYLDMVLPGVAEKFSSQTEVGSAA